MEYSASHRRDGVRTRVGAKPPGFLVYFRKAKHFGAWASASSECWLRHHGCPATGAHLETRVLALLKKLQTATQMPPVGQPKSKQSRLTATFGAKGAPQITSDVYYVTPD